MKKVTSFFFLVGILAFILLLSGCKGCRTEPTQKVDIKNAKIKIITFVPHEVLDEIVLSAKNYLIDSLQVNKDNIEVYNPNGKADEIQTYVRSLTSSNTDIIISVSTPATKAVLVSRHPSIPLVFSFVSDTSALNLSNFTNVSGISNVLDYAKGFELFKQLLPNAQSIGVLYNPSEQNSVYSFNQIKEVASKQNPPIKVVAAQFTKPEEISVVASTFNNIDAYYVGGDNKLVSNFPSLLKTANAKKIPVFASDEGSVKKGAIGAYSINYSLFGIETAKLLAKRLNNGNSFNEIIMYSAGRDVKNDSAFVNFKK